MNSYFLSLKLIIIQKHSCSKRFSFLPYPIVQSRMIELNSVFKLGVAMRAGPSRLGPPRPAHFMWAAYSGTPHIYVGPRAYGPARFFF